MECIDLMKPLKVWLSMALVGLLLLPVVSLAETVYVSEDFEITLRTGPGTDRKIIALVQSGKALEMLERGDEWSMVREPNGKEGWALTRYLTTNRPCAMVLERVRQDYDVLTSKYKTLDERFNTLNSQKTSTDADLNQSRQERDELKEAYENLRKESSEFLKLKKRHQEIVAALEAEKTRSAKLDEENMQMKRSRIIQWVWTGGGILLIGFVLGLFSSSRRKSRSSLY
jgi:SH3 domain protein